MKNRKSKEIKKIIDDEIEKSKKSNNLEGIWKKIRNSIHIVANHRVASAQFTKDYGQTPYDYFRRELFNSILLRIVKKEIRPPKSDKQTILGIKRLKHKIQDFYDKPFEKILREKEEELSNKSSSEEAKVEVLLRLYRPVVVDPFIKDQIDALDVTKNKYLLLYHGSNTLLDFLMPNETIKLRIPLGELNGKLKRFEEFDLENPRLCGDKYVYSHKYTENEVKLLKSAISQNFDIYINQFEFVLPEEKETKKLELYQYIIKDNLNTMANITSKINRSEEYVIDQVVNAIVNGYLAFR